MRCILKVRVVGAGLAGCEAAIYLAERGYDVELYEMRPRVKTGVHKTSDFAEFVCSNSLGSKLLTVGSGLLKEEAKLLGSYLIQAAYKCSVPAGGSLAIDRVLFSKMITDKIFSLSNIKVIREEYNKIITDVPTLIASGPLTSDALCNEIIKFSAEENFSFFDAVAPIIEKESIDFNKAFYASRYDKGDADYINCPMNKVEYLKFYNILINAESVVDMKAAKFFESCLPVEIIAKRGENTLRFGPLKPVGLCDKRTLEKPYAVVQLRQDDKMANLYNLVGFQTNLKWGEQKRLIQSIPGLENAKIVRYGVMHANTFINSPNILNKTLQSKKSKNIFFAGQLTGVEGYTESIATGLFAAINIDKFLRGEELLELCEETMLGALLSYITYKEHRNFQPVNSNWGIIAPMEMDKATRRNKELKNGLLAKRALKKIEAIRKSL